MSVQIYDVFNNDEPSKIIIPVATEAVFESILAINRDGTIRWKIADIVKVPEPVSYADLTRGNDSMISVLAVMSRQYDCIIFEIDVYEQKIVRQYSEGDCS